jgi:hypothetical protein
MTRKMKIEDVRKCYHFKKFSEEDDEAECDSNWTSKESLAANEEDNKVEMYYDENTQMYTQQKRKRGRPRKYNKISSNNSISGNKILKFAVSRNSMSATPQKPINPSDRIGSHMNSTNSINFHQGAFSNILKRDDKLKQRSFIQNNYTTCKTDSRSFFEKERKRKFLGHPK